MKFGRRKLVIRFLLFFSLSFKNGSSYARHMHIYRPPHCSDMAILDKALRPLSPWGDYKIFLVWRRILIDCEKALKGPFPPPTIKENWSQGGQGKLETVIKCVMVLIFTWYRYLFSLRSLYEGFKFGWLPGNLKRSLTNAESKWWPGHSGSMFARYFYDIFIVFSLFQPILLDLGKPLA